MVMKVNGTSGLTFPDTTTLASAGQSSVRAWVNFNGTGTPAVRASYNVSSITDNGTGDYTVNFTTALPDNDYSFMGAIGIGATNSSAQVVKLWNGDDVDTYMLTNSVRIKTVQTTASTDNLVDPQYCGVAIFR